MTWNIPSWMTKKVPCILCHLLVKYPSLRVYFARCRYMWAKSPTSATRFWFGLADLGFASFVLLSPTIHSPLSEYVLMLKIAPDELWGIAYLVHCCALWYGVLTRRYSHTLLVLEGVLGVVLWTASAVCVGIAQGAPGATCAGLMMAYWLLVRYPAPEEYHHAD